MYYDIIFLVFFQLLLIYKTYKISYNRDKRYPIEDIGLFIIICLAGYTILPVLSWLLQGGEYIIPGSRLSQIQPPKNDILYVQLVSIFFSFGVFLYYHKNKKNMPLPINYKINYFISDSIFFASIFIFLSNLIINGILTSILGLDLASSYTETYKLRASIPLQLAQFLNLLNAIAHFSKIVIVVGGLQRWYRLKFIIYLFLFITILVFDKAGARSFLFINLFLFIVIYHLMVNEISSLRITIIGLFGLVYFIILGILRVTSLENVSFQFGLPLGEFDTIFANSLHLLGEKNDNNLEVPFTLFLNDFFSFVPSQILPYEKIDYSNWYLNNYYPEFKALGGGLAFGLVAQIILGYGIIESFIRGIFVGLISIWLLKWVRVRNGQWWKIVVFISILLSSYNVVRDSNLVPIIGSLPFMIFSLLIIHMVSKLIRRQDGIQIFLKS